MKKTETTVKRMALVFAATALVACESSAQEGTDGASSTVRTGKSDLDFVALADTPKDAAITTEQFLSICETFVTDVNDIPRNEGDPNPMEVMRDMGAEDFCACVETTAAEDDSNRRESEASRNAPTRYMAHQLAKTKGELRGRPSMGDTVEFGRRIDTCFTSASAAYAD